jgi:hypothetical protein
MLLDSLGAVRSSFPPLIPYDNEGPALFVRGDLSCSILVEWFIVTARALYYELLSVFSWPTIAQVKLYRMSSVLLRRSNIVHCQNSRMGPPAMSATKNPAFPGRSYTALLC